MSNGLVATDRRWQIGMIAQHHVKVIGAIHVSAAWNLDANPSNRWICGLMSHAQLRYGPSDTLDSLGTFLGHRLFFLIRTCTDTFTDDIYRHCCIIGPLCYCSVVLVHMRRSAPLYCISSLDFLTHVIRFMFFFGGKRKSAIQYSACVS